MLGEEAGRANYKFLPCRMLVDFIREAVPYLSPELLHYLKAKICNRLAKLESSAQDASTNVQPIYDRLFDALRPHFDKAIQMPNNPILESWTNFRKTSEKSITPLRKRATKADLCLKLENSESYLTSVVQRTVQFNKSAAFNPKQVLEDFTRLQASTRCFQDFASRYFELSEMESSLSLRSRISSPANSSGLETECRTIATGISTYVDAAVGLYDLHSEQNSIMILNLFEQWMLMDHLATSIKFSCHQISRKLSPFHLPMLQVFAPIARL